MNEEDALPRPPSFDDSQLDVSLPTSPMTPEAAAQAVAKSQAMRPPQVSKNLVKDFGEAGFQARNIEEGVPLDITSGMPSWDYFKGSFERLKNKQLEYYQKLGYPARLSDTGEIIVRVMDSKTGKPKDVLANPHGIDYHDFLDLVAQTPEIAGGILAARKGGGRGVWQGLINLARMAGGTEGAGVMKDVAARELQGVPVDLGEIFSSRAQMGVGDVAMGGALGVGTKLGTKLISPFSEKGPLQFNLQKAQDYFKAKGFDLHSTPGETTGNPFLLRMEAFARQNPGSSVPFDALATQTANDVQQIQNIMLGLPAAATEADIAAMRTPEQVGKDVTGAIGSKNLALEGQVAKAKSQLAKTTTEEIGREFESAAGRPAASRTELGQSLRTRVQADYDAFKAQAERNYAAVEANPLVKEKNIPADPLAADAKKLVKELPSVETTITTDTGLKDFAGRPILKTEKGEKILWEFVPAGLKAKLLRLSELEGQSFRLDELLQMRREIRNSINQAQAIPGVQTRTLSRMEDMVDTRIRDGLQDLDPRLKALWEKANTEYAEGIKRFREHGIANALKTPEQPGFVGSRDLADRAINDPDWMTAYRNYFGAASPEYRQVKRAVLDDLATFDPLTGSIKGANFFANLERMAKDKPEVLREVMGPNWKKIVQLAKVNEYALATKPLQIDAEELAKIVGSGTASERQLFNLLEAETKRQTAYQNTLRRSVQAGTLKPDSIRPSEFVRYMSRSAEPAEINEVLALLHDRPELLEDIRRVTVSQILNDASASPRALDVIATHGRVSKELTASGLEDALRIGDRTAMQRYKSILGQDTWNDLMALRDYLRPRELKQSAFQTAGGLSAGTKIAALERGGILHFADTALKNFIFATLYTSRPLKAWLSNNAITGRDAATAVNYMIASTPFVEALRRDFQNGAAAKARNIKAALDAYIRQSSQPESQQGGALPAPPF